MYNENSQEIEVSMRIKNHRRAIGSYNPLNNKVNVFKGSDINIDSTSVTEKVYRVRKKYTSIIENGKLTNDSGYISPTASAVLVLGWSANGRTLWKDSSMRTLDEIDEALKNGNVEENVDILIDNIAEEQIDTDIEVDCEDTDINNSDNGEELKLTPEEMLAKGLVEILKSNRNATVEIADGTIDKLGNRLSEVLNHTECEEEYTWGSIADGSYEQFNDSIFGYSLEECKTKLELKKSLLLMGVPGTGKTKILKSLLSNITDGDKSKYQIISFSQNTDYTDFIGGLICINGKWTYTDGVLTKMCKAADKDINNKYYLGIDELSRGNTEAIFGELMTGIEHRNTLITLKTGRTLVIPSNLYIIGTMNISDNSTKKLDIATLERFTQYRIEPQWSRDYIEWLCSKANATSEVTTILKTVSDSMARINKTIKNDRLLGQDKLIGTRAISGIELTLANVKIAIENQLLTEVKKRVINCEDSGDISDYIEKIEGAVK